MTHLDIARWYFDATPPSDGPPRHLAQPSSPPWLPPPPRPRTIDWTLERIADLSSREVSQLRANAERLDDVEIATRCSDVLKGRPENGGAHTATAPKKEHRLVSRSTAFGLRGATLANRFWSRSAVTRGGDIIFALWAADVRHDRAGASHLLWAPNVEGSRPWSDKPAGRERLEHCQRALKRGSASGLLIYGERLEDTLPDEKAARVDGIDPGLLLRLGVEMRGEEYWATWGGRRA